MKYNTLSVLAVTFATATADAVGNGQTTNAISFNGLPGSFSYQIASSLQNTASGVQCSLANVEATGPLAPLTSEMHHIFRGPMNVMQFAVYQPQANPSKREAIRESPMERRGRINHLDRHKVKHSHKHEDVEKRVYGQWVTATIDGSVVSFIDNWSPHAPTAAAVAPAPAEPAPTQAATNNNTPAPKSQAQPSSNSASTSSTSTSDSGSDQGATSNAAWNRVAYFDASSGTTENIAFTANNNFAMGYGFTQGYVASDGVDAASSPQALSGFIPDNYEVIVSSGSPCSAGDTSGGCAVTAPGSAAHHGFGGDRVVVMQYTMPDSSCSNCGNKYTGNSANTNLPAIWALNSGTVNIAQYGLGPGGECSGWTSGAGEFDIHEILPGDEPSNIGYASFHMGDHYSGTAPQGFVRPTNPSQPQTLAYVLSGSYAGIHILGDNFDMAQGLTADDVNALINGQNDAANSQVQSTSSKIANSGSPFYQVDVDSVSFTAILSG